MRASAGLREQTRHQKPGGQHASSRARPGAPSDYRPDDCQCHLPRAGPPPHLVSVLLAGRFLRLSFVVSLRSRFGTGKLFLDLFVHATFAPVIGDVPSFTFELYRRPGNLLLQAPAALLTTGRRLVRKLLVDLNLSITLLATKFVDWHRVDLLLFSVEEVASDYTRAPDPFKPCQVEMPDIAAARPRDFAISFLHNLHVFVMIAVIFRRRQSRTDVLSDFCNTFPGCNR